MLLQSRERDSDQKACEFVRGEHNVHISLFIGFFNLVTVLTNHIGAAQADVVMLAVLSDGIAVVPASIALCPLSLHYADGEAALALSARNIIGPALGKYITWAIYDGDLAGHKDEAEVVHTVG